MSHTNQPATFADQICHTPGGEQMVRCYSCGTCTATCPIQWIEEAYNPRRIIKMVMLDLREQVLSDPVIWLCSACDVCYHRCPQDVHISDIMQAIRTIAIQEGYAPLRPVAEVNERACASCGMCAQACPYQAIEMVPRWVLMQQTLRQRRALPQVNKFLCQGCNICANTCPVSAISMTDSSDREVIAQIRAFAQEAGVSR